MGRIAWDDSETLEVARALEFLGLPTDPTELSQAVAAVGPPLYEMTEHFEVYRERGTVQFADGLVAPSGQILKVTGDIAVDLYAGSINGDVSVALQTIPGVTGAWYVFKHLTGPTVLYGGMNVRWQNPPAGVAPGDVTLGSGLTCGAFSRADNLALTPGSGVYASAHIVATRTAMQVAVIEDGTFRGLTPVGRNGAFAPGWSEGTFPADGKTVGRVRFAIDPVAGRMKVRGFDGEVYLFEDEAITHPCPYAFTEGVITATTDCTPAVVSDFFESRYAAREV